MEFARLAANAYISLVLDCRDYADHYQNLKDSDVGKGTHTLMKKTTRMSSWKC